MNPVEKREMRSRALNQNGLIPEDRDVMVFAMKRHNIGDNRVDPDYHSDKHQIFRDMKAHIASIVGNFDLPVKVRIEKLNDLSKKFSTGWPFKNNSQLDGFRVDTVPVLARLAAATADALSRNEQVKFSPNPDKCDIGRMGHST